MKQILMLLFFCIPALAYTQEIRYVAAKSGLSLRAGNSSKSPVVVKMPYGESVSLDTITTKNQEGVETDGMYGAYIPVVYKGQKGFVTESYLLPIPPPKPGTKTMTDYAGQISSTTCPPVIFTDTIERFEDTPYADTVVGHTSMLYKNGVVYTKKMLSLSTSQSLIIPDISMQQAFIIAQNIEDMGELIFNTVYPKEDMTEKTEEGSRGVSIFYPNKGPATETPEKVSFWEEGFEVHNSLNITMLNYTQVVITLNWEM